MCMYLVVSNYLGVDPCNYVFVQDVVVIMHSEESLSCLCCHCCCYPSASLLLSESIVANKSIAPSMLSTAKRLLFHTCGCMFKKVVTTVVPPLAVPSTTARRICLHVTRHRVTLCTLNQ
jgi:hypothetical protein